MNSLQDLIKLHSIRHSSKIRKICAPLVQELGIPIFSHYYIDRDGRFGSLTNDFDSLDYYYETEQYLSNPYLSNPDLFRPGYAIAPITFDSASLEVMHRKFGIYYFFIMIQQRGTGLDAFLFANKSADPQETFSYLSQIDLLQKFASYFKREAKEMIEEMKEKRYDLKKAKGDRFFHIDSFLPLLRKNPATHKFLKSIAPLSPQEVRCLELYKMGYSSQMVASLLGLSVRSIEDYYNHIKNKLSCASKAELLQW